jgi:hypothetical protein
MNERSLPDHRRRYRALDDRRRLGFELERIWGRIERHPAWPDRPLPARRALAELLELRASPPHAHVERLDADVRNLTRRLVLLAKALQALETGTPLPDVADRA